MSTERKPLFDTVSIIGVGLLGGSLAAAFKRSDVTERIIGISSPRSIEKAKELEIIDQGYGYQELAQGLNQSELIILCTPIVNIIELMPKVASCAHPNALITDVGSTKREIMATAAKCFPKGMTFIGGHPMAGSEKSGVSATDPFLFENAIYVLTPDDKTPKDKLDKLSRGFSCIGAQVVILQPDLHDQIAATISHLPQMLAIGLVNLIESVPEHQSIYLRLAAGGFRDMTRIASSPFAMWRDIYATNADLIQQKLDEYIALLKQFKELVGQEALGDRYTTANRLRDTIPKDTKGFLFPLPNVLVVTKDKPGILARMTKALADHNINISDIEVLKVREGEGGTIRLSVKDNTQAEKAVQILREQGFEARVPE